MAHRMTSSALQTAKSPLKMSSGLQGIAGVKTPSRTPVSSPCDSSLSVASGVSAPPSPTPLSLTPAFKKDMCKFLAHEHKNYDATQYTGADDSSAVWSEPLPQFPSWKEAFTYNLDAPAAAHDAVAVPRGVRAQATATSPFKVLAPQISESLGETMATTKPKEIELKKSEFNHLKSMVNSSTVIRVPVEGNYGYNAKVDGSLLPSEQYALRVAAHFLDASSPARLLADLEACNLPNSFTSNQRSLFNYLNTATAPGGEICLHDVVRIIAAQDADFATDDFLRMSVESKLEQAKLVYLDLSNADSYLASMQAAMGPNKVPLAQATYREFLAAPLRLKEKWNQTDFVVVPVYQGMNQPRVMGILKTAASGRMKISNSADFKDLAIAGLRNYYAAQPEGARRERDGRAAVAELKAEVVEVDSIIGNLAISVSEAEIPGFSDKVVASVLDSDITGLDDRAVDNLLASDVSGLDDRVIANILAGEQKTAVPVPAARIPQRAVVAKARPMKVATPVVTPKKTAVSSVSQKKNSGRSISPSQILNSFLADVSAIAATSEGRLKAGNRLTPNADKTKTSSRRGSISKEALVELDSLIGKFREEITWL